MVEERQKTKPRDRLIQNKFLDTNLLWLQVSIALFVLAALVHAIAELAGWYDNTNIDLYTHFLGVLGATALFLNVRFPRNPRFYWVVYVVFAFLLGLVWEIFEETVEFLGIFTWIQNEFTNALQDLFVDTLGGIVAVFMYERIFMLCDFRESDL